ncbi:site-specific integrase [Bacillus cereus]|uniref:Site-specific recombinase, phage integrase family n=1 Tax=Bacillus cereus (strain 03BB102) TaxID=572264 RepID=A0A158RNK5_BACC3|nr:site-specific integrase [Bacillus cereus]ACO28786.1 site-specific recombinase, phage integrase family [Bacillus cereus 03BB102]AJG54917.1 phage integrase family protein [Bacillus cereus 03BB102]QPR82986.1 site-specific integrase [Bacillus cereus]
MKGHIRKRGNKYCIVIDIGPDPETGKRRQKWFSGYKTKKEAQADVAKKITELNEGTFVEPSKITLKDYLIQWLEIKKMSVEKSSLSRYQSNINKHIIPNIGMISLHKLNVMHIQKCYQSALNSGIANNTILFQHRILTAALNLAVKQNIIPRNPATLAVIPKKEKSSIQTWTEEEVKQFLLHSQESRYHIGYLLAITTGMRLGEVLGLRWQDVDFNNHTVTINQTLGHDNKIKTSAKNNSSKRTIPIPLEVIEELKKCKLQVNKDKLRIGPAYHDLDLIICNKLGEVTTRTTFTRHFDKVIKNAGIKKIKFHDTRHTHATLLLKQGVHPKVVSERLGHSDISLTLRVYSHVLPNIQEDAVKAFAKSIF